MNQNNVYATETYHGEALGTEEQIEEWYQLEKKYVPDPNLRYRWPYGYHIRNRGFENK